MPGQTDLPATSRDAFVRIDPTPRGRTAAVANDRCYEEPKPELTFFFEAIRHFAEFCCMAGSPFDLSRYPLARIRIVDPRLRRGIPRYRALIYELAETTHRTAPAIQIETEMSALAGYEATTSRIQNAVVAGLLRRLPTPFDSPGELRNNPAWIANRATGMMPSDPMGSTGVHTSGDWGAWLERRGADTKESGRDSVAAVLDNLREITVTSRIVVPATHDRIAIRRAVARRAS